MTLVDAVRFAQFIAAISAVLVARRRADYRPLALFLVAATIANMGRVALRVLVLAPSYSAIVARGLDPAVVPFTGWARVAGHAEHALFLMWPTGVAALACVVFVRLRPWFLVIPWLTAVAVLTSSYPAIRGDLLRRFYLGAELAAVMVGIGCFILWVWRRERRSRRTVKRSSCRPFTRSALRWTTGSRA